MTSNTLICSYNGASLASFTEELAKPFNANLVIFQQAEVHHGLLSVGTILFKRKRRVRKAITVETTGHHCHTVRSRLETPLFFPLNFCNIHALNPKPLCFRSLCIDVPSFGLTLIYNPWMLLPFIVKFLV